MRRHSNEGREPVKARRRKTVTRKRRNSPKAPRRRSITGTAKHDVLVGRGLLNSETRHDPRAVTEALYAHLDQTLSSVQ